MKLIFYTLLILVINSTLSFSQYNTEFLAKKTYTGQNLSGSWGYTDTINNKEYALVGTTRGLSIVDITTPTNPVEVKFINGKQGTWRECQTYKNYAYITQDNDTTNSEGVLIYDLSQIPLGKADTFKGTTVNDYIARTHSLFIDEKGFLYLNGGDARVNGTRTNGVLIYDLKPNPMKPTYIGFTQNLFGTGAVNYVHDCYARNDTMYQAHIYNNRFTIWNISNRANPIKIADYATPYSTIHNLWLSDDSKTLFATHEQFNMPIEAYDISDLSNIHQIDEFRINPTNEEIAHNIHVKGDFAYASYYSDGVAIFDIADPTNVVTVGYYDTQPTVTRAYSGVWGAYGYYKSGVMTLSDMTKGLFVIKPTYIKAARIQGTITDTNTHIELAGVKISFVDTANSVLTNIDGTYKTGSVKSGTTNFKAEKTGYITKYFSANLVNGTTLTVDLQLRQIPIYVTRNITICEGSTYTFADGTDSIITVAGTYYTNLMTPSGRDSIIITNITLKNKTYSTLNVAMCPNSIYFMPSGRPISQAGTYLDTIENSLRCDSIIIIHLTIKQTSSSIINDYFCEGSNYLLPNGTYTTIADTYNFTYQNSVGCDSFITVNLQKQATYTQTIYDTINVGNYYILLNGDTAYNSGTYTFTFPTAFYCDSVVTIELFVVDTITTNLNYLYRNNDFNCYFNNSTLYLNIKPNNLLINRLIIYNLVGETVANIVNPTQETPFLNLPKGIYLIQAISNQNKNYIAKVIKQE